MTVWIASLFNSVRCNSLPPPATLTPQSCGELKSSSAVGIRSSVDTKERDALGRLVSTCLTDRCAPWPSGSEGCGFRGLGLMGLGFRKLDFWSNTPHLVCHSTTAPWARLVAAVVPAAVVLVARWRWPVARGGGPTEGGHLKPMLRASVCLSQQRNSAKAPVHSRRSGTASQSAPFMKSSICPQSGTPGP